MEWMDERTRQARRHNRGAFTSYELCWARERQWSETMVRADRYDKRRSQYVNQVSAMNRRPVKQNIQTTALKSVWQSEFAGYLLDDYAITQTITWQQVGHVGELKQAALLFHPDK